MAAQPQLQDIGERLERTSVATRLAGVFGLVLALNLLGWGLLLYAAPKAAVATGAAADTEKPKEAAKPAAKPATPAKPPKKAK